MSPIIFFLQVQSTLKLLHWYTTSYAQHVALDKLHQDVADLSDKFVEVMIGKYGRPKLAKKDLSFNMDVPNPSASVAYFDTCIKYLVELPLDAVKDGDLINLRDELVAAFNQTKYLFTLT